MMLGICASIAAPFLRLLNEPPFGILIVGPSTGGKTTATLVSGSFNGIATELDLLNWNATAAGIEQQAEIHSDLSCQIDDLKNYSGSDRELYKLVSELAYRTTSGSRKMAQIEAKQRIVGRPPAMRGVSTIILTSAEDSLDSLARAAGDRAVPDGLRVRLVEVPTLSREDGGVFDLLPRMGTPQQQMEARATIAKQIAEACANNHGWPLIRLLEQISKSPKAAAKSVERYRRLFVEEAAFDRSDPYQRRHAQRFGFLYGAGAYAVDIGLLPWSHDLLRSAVRKCHQDSLAIISKKSATSGDKDRLRSGLEKLKSLLAAQDRFANFNGSSSVANTLGWKAVKRDRTVFYIRGDAWRETFGSTGQRKEVEQYLIARHQLRAGPKGPITVQPRIGSAKMRGARCYQLTVPGKNKKVTATGTNGVRHGK
jgi:hypothetical protein